MKLQVVAVPVVKYSILKPSTAELAQALPHISEHVFVCLIENA